METRVSLPRELIAGDDLNVDSSPAAQTLISDVRKVLTFPDLQAATDFHPQNQLSQNILSLESPNILATLFNQLCGLDPLC